MTPWTVAHQASLSFTISRSLLKFKSIESVMPSNILILCCPLLLLPSTIPSIRVFSNELTLCIRWLQHQLSDEYSGLISFRTDWFDQLYVYIYPSLLALPPNPAYHLVEFFKLTVTRTTWLYFYKVIIWTRMINIVIQGTWVIESDEGDESCWSQGSMSSKDPSTKDPDNSFVYSRYARTTDGMIPSIL